MKLGNVLAKLALASAVLLPLVFLANRDWIRGYLQPDLVVSGSMAPALPGPHYRQTCVECEISIVSGGEFTDLDQSLVCPNCGRRQSWLATAKLRQGTQTWIDTRAPFRRWRVYAYRNADEELEIKRLVGLPGERVTIEDGDVLVNGRRLQKGVRQLRDMAIVVHRLGPTNSSPTNSSQLASNKRATNTHRWANSPHSPLKPDDRRAFWTPVESGWQFRGDRSVPLIYHHFLSYESPWPRDTPSPIQDDYAYNANQSRQLHAVTDFGLECTLDLARDSQVECRLATPAGEISVAIGRGGPMGAGAGIVVRHGKETQRWSIHPPRGPTGLLVGVCDRRLLWEYGGRSGAMPLNWDRELDSGQKSHNSRRKMEGRKMARKMEVRDSYQPVRIVAFGPVDLANLEIWRDVYYYQPSYALPPEQLAAGQMLLLGDNVPIAMDGRFTPAGTAQWRIVGQVKSRVKNRVSLRSWP